MWSGGIMGTPMQEFVIVITCPHQDHPRWVRDVGDGGLCVSFHTTMIPSTVRGSQKDVLIFHNNNHNKEKRIGLVVLTHATIPKQIL